MDHLREDILPDSSLWAVVSRKTTITEIPLPCDPLAINHPSRKGGVTVRRLEYTAILSGTLIPRRWMAGYGPHTIADHHTPILPEGVDVTAFLDPEYVPERF